jgi:DNA-binding CsgD family transcriptional regulator
VQSRTAASEAADRIRRMSVALTDSHALRLAVIEELRAVVGFDSYAWLMTDPHSWVGSSPLADVPCLRELPTLIRLKYLTEVNRWTALPRPGLDRLHARTEGDLALSLLGQHLQHRFDVTDVASLAFIDRFGCWGFLDLWRSRPAQPFTADEATFLTRLVKPLTEGLRRCQAATFTAQVDSPILAHADPAVLLLSADLTVVAQTGQAQQYVQLLVPPQGGRGPVPAGAYNVAAQLLAVEHGVDDHPPRARVHIAGGTWLTLQAARIAPAGAAVTSAEPAEIAVTIELASPTDRAAIYAPSHGFTARETEILNRLLTGADSRDLARSLYLSEHTVQDYLKNIFTKTGTRSRRQLIGTVIGNRK